MLKTAKINLINFMQLLPIGPDWNMLFLLKQGINTGQSVDNIDEYLFDPNGKNI